MKIGILIDDSGFENKDFKNIDKGNPGVGGTTYEEIMLAHYLSLDSEYSVEIYTTHISNIYGEKINNVHVDDINSVPSKAKEDGIDILIFAADRKLSWYSAIDGCGLHCIAWVHGFLNYYELRELRKLHEIEKIVFVGKQHYLSYIADDIVEKSTYIFNMFETPTRPQESMPESSFSLHRDETGSPGSHGSELEASSSPQENDPESSLNPNRREFEHDVCYLGALNRYKGFHVLAQAWPIVLKEVPDARLFVIGKGNLYDNKRKMGKYGISDESYEKKFIRYITDSDGRILPSVIFKGNLGIEKKELISKMAVGVVNPTAVTETFCISAIEINSCGVPVCTTGKRGLLDTVIDKKTGLFSDDYKGLAENIISLLKDKEKNLSMSEACIENAKKFTPEKIMPHWKKLFDDVTNEKKVIFENISDKRIQKFKYRLFKYRIINGHKAFPSFIKFEFLFQGMTRVFFRDEIYHLLGRDR